VQRAHSLLREAVLAAVVAASLASLLAWLGPPGGDVAAHVYQRSVFLSHGFELWNNLWYSGRYGFITYSVLYYPLAGLLGIKLLAVASIVTAALAFTVVVGRQWGPLARWSSRTFAVVWTGLIVSGAYPFALGFALGLLALWAIQSGKRWRFGVLAVLTAAASPLAFLLLAICLAGVGLAIRDRGRRLLVVPGLVILGVAGMELVLNRAFSDGGRYPFSMFDLGCLLAFCVLGAALTWRVERAHTIRWFFVAYGAASLATFVVTSPLGANIARLKFAALPIAVLVLSLRRWRPLPVAALVMVLAASWNLTPHANSFSEGRAEPSANVSYWQPAIGFLHRHLTPSYRVEVVDTFEHWAAVYLPRAGIPITRGWYRQDDFPQNEVLYDRLDRPGYLHWLRSLGARYVVLTDAPSDYSSKKEALLIRAGHSSLVPVLHTAHITIYAVPKPRPMITGPAPATVLELAQTEMMLRFGGPGQYRLAVRYSPYWSAVGACVTQGDDGMIRLDASRGGPVRLRFKVDTSRALAAVVGAQPTAC
jgi:hypothetical protein